MRLAASLEREVKETELTHSLSKQVTSGLVLRVSREWRGISVVCQLVGFTDVCGKDAHR